MNAFPMIAACMVRQDPNIPACHALDGCGGSGGESVPFTMNAEGTVSAADILYDYIPLGVA